MEKENLDITIIKDEFTPSKPWRGEWLCEGMKLWTGQFKTIKGLKSELEYNLGTNHKLNFIRG